MTTKADHVSRRGAAFALPVLPVTVISMLGLPDSMRAQTGDDPAGWTHLCKSIRDFDVLPIRGDRKLTVGMFGCRMRNYRAEAPITIQNDAAIVQAIGRIDKDETPFNHPLTTRRKP